MNRVLAVGVSALFLVSSALKPLAAQSMPAVCVGAAPNGANLPRPPAGWLDGIGRTTLPRIGALLRPTGSTLDTAAVDTASVVRLWQHDSIAVAWSLATIVVDGYTFPREASWRAAELYRQLDGDAGKLFSMMLTGGDWTHAAEVMMAITKPLDRADLENLVSTLCNALLLQNIITQYATKYRFILGWDTERTLYHGYCVVPKTERETPGGDPRRHWVRAIVQGNWSLGRRLTLSVGPPDREAGVLHADRRHGGLPPDGLQWQRRELRD